MRVLAIADHNPHINIQEVVEREKIELIITLGDLTREDIIGLPAITTVPKIGIYGNHDSGSYMEELGIWDMHLKMWDFQGKTFGGFQGCVRYKQNPDAIMCTQEEATALMQHFPRVDVFISHCPPRGINDEDEIAHQGFDALRQYIDTYQPESWLHGHTYPTEEEMVRQHGPTAVHYVTKYAILDI